MHGGYTDFNWLLFLSGQAVKCNPTTGSVDRHILFSTDDGVPLRVNAVQVEG